MGEHSKALMKKKSMRRSPPFQESDHFPPLVDSDSSHDSKSKQSTCSSSKSSRSSRKRRSSRVSSSVSSLSSSSSASSCVSRASSCASSRTSSGYSTLSSRSSLSGKSSHSGQNLDAFLEELESDRNDIGHRLLSGVLGESRGDPHSPPPSRVVTGAHYLKWYIPPQIAGSRTASRSAKPAAANHSVNELSPLHSPEKQMWLNKLIDPKGTSLPLPKPYKPRLPDHSKTAAKRADNIHEAFSKYQLDTNPSKHFSNSSHKKYGQRWHPPSSYSQIKREPPTLKSLLLEHDKQAYSSSGAGDQLDPLSNSFFMTSHLPVQSWFIVNPEWRKEPGKR